MLEYVDFDVFFVFLFQLHHVFERVHAAEVATVRIMRLIPTAHTLDECYAMRLFARQIGEALCRLWA
jgi:hypothetical protein